MVYYLLLEKLLCEYLCYTFKKDTYTNTAGITWIYNNMDAVVDGVQLGDSACVQLSVDYINDNIMAPTTRIYSGANGKSSTPCGASRTPEEEVG